MDLSRLSELGDSVAVFRSSPGSLFKFGLVAVGATALIAASISAWEFPGDPLSAHLRRIGLLASVWLPALAWCWLFATVVVHFNGLRAYGRLGQHHAVPWGAIRSAESSTLLGLRYLRIEACEPEVLLYVPLFLSDFERFRVEVSRLAGESHPISVALRAPAA